VEALVAAAARLRSRQAPSRTPAQCGRELVRIRHALDLMELEFSRRSAEFAATDEYEVQGSTSAVDWIRHHCNTSGHAASLAVCIGEQMDRLSASVAAVEQGVIGRGHLALLARTANSVTKGDIDAPFDETELLHKATEHSVGRFKFDCDHARHAADAAAFLDEHLDAVGRRRLELLPCEDGNVSIRGLLDPVGGATLRTVLEPLARRDGAGDDRDLQRRMADALVELAHHGLDAGAAPQQSQQRPHLQVTASLETLLAAPSSPAGELEFSSPIPAATVQRLACDSSVSRLVFNAKSEIVNVGRKYRVANGAIRRALTHRDRGCVWPGCERSSSWTAAHHLRHWAHGGATDLNNLVLICHRHHQMVHEGGWELARSESGDVHAVPPLMPRHSPYARAPAG
jgi:Domain of unknown function (DUF222)/HNH endonuclease